MKLNVGSGDHPLDGYCNLDIRNKGADLIAKVPPLPFQSETLDEIYAGHFLEHLDFWAGRRFLHECWRCLKLGGKLAVVVPNTKAIVQAYIQQENLWIELPKGAWHNLNDLDSICRLFLYSPDQNTPHVWSYDLDTLKTAMCRSRFCGLRAIDNYTDTRLASPAWYQCGLEGVKM